MGNSEWGIRNAEVGMGKAEVGRRTRRRPIERDYAVAKDAECGKDDYRGPR